MYLYPNPTFIRGGDQIKLRAPFLLLLQRADDRQLRPQLYACIRSVALRQLGHWMMGRANLNGKWHTISGAYGSDGLPMDVDCLPADAVELPPDLAEAYWKGDGWNCAGSEAPLLRQWAIELINHRRAA